MIITIIAMQAESGVFTGLIPASVTLIRFTPTCITTPGILIISAQAYIWALVTHPFTLADIMLQDGTTHSGVTTDGTGRGTVFTMAHSGMVTIRATWRAIMASGAHNTVTGAAITPTITITVLMAPQLITMVRAGQPAVP